MNYLTEDKRKIGEKQKIVVFLEVSWHHDVLTTTMEISHYFKKWKSVFIVSESVLRRLGKVDTSNVIRIEDMYRYKWSKFSQIKKILNLPKLHFVLKEQGKNLVTLLKSIDFDVLVINTLTEPTYFAPLFRWIKDTDKKLVVILHNTHYWDLKWFIKNISIDEIKNRKFENLIFNMFYKKYIDGIITLGGYILTPNCFENIPKLVIPSRLSSSSHPDLKMNEKVYFVIPGKVQKGRNKNYKRVIMAFEKVLSENPNYQEKVKLVLLGKLIFQQIKEYIFSHNLDKNIIYFESFVSEKIYQEWLNKAHFVIIPIATSTPYGKYKISGALNDAFSNGIPILLPTNYAPHYNFSGNVIRFSWENLENVIKYCISIVLRNNKEYKNLLNESIKVKDLYTPAVIANKFEKFLDILIENKDIS